MKTCVAKFVAGSKIRLAVLSVLLLGMAGVSMAQASAARPAAQALASAAQPAAHVQPVAQAAQTASPGEPAAKGNQEGIKVHGHWTIDVRNPDGTLAQHREFENSLCQNGGPPASCSVTGGAALLAAILGRTAVGGSWAIQLVDSTQSTFIVTLVEPNSFASTSYGCPSPNCSTNLVLTPPQPVTAGELQAKPLTLSGSGTVPSGAPAAIGYVDTVNLFCGTAQGTIPAGDCFNDTGAEATAANNGGYPPIAAVFTARALDGLNGDPAAVPIAAGQTVNVSVQISFQ